MKKALYIFLILFTIPLFSQQIHTVDIKTGTAAIEIAPHKKEVKGRIHYSLEMLKDTDSIFIDARQMTFTTVTLNHKKVRFYNDGSKLWIIYPFRAKTTHTIEIAYTAMPEKAMYFIGWNHAGGKKQVWTQGQGKYTSNWLPSFDDVNEKVVFNFTITFHKDYEVISNGTLTTTHVKDSLKTWQFNMQQPMSSYLVALAIGKYRKKTLRSEKGVPLLLYYYPEDSLKVEPTYRYTATIFDVLEKETGVAYPWQNYKQVPVRDFLYAGMENTSVTLFSDAYVVDAIAFSDRNYVNVNAHELAHQWFGNLVTAKSGTHHWLQEGFATYYALLAEREIFGNDHYYWKLYQTAAQLIAMSDQKKGEKLLNASASSLTFYEKGAWALHILREETGDIAFKKGVKNYLLKYRFKTATTRDFITVMEQASGKELSGFVDVWLMQDAFPGEAALASLRKNKFLKQLLDIKKEKLPEYSLNAISAKNYFPLNQEMVFRYNAQPTEKKLPLYKKVLQSDLLKERQAVAMALDPIPRELKEDFESLLSDKSYSTIESALYKLWANFPESRETYLNKTRGISGFSDKNVELLWLALALVTPNYEADNKPQYYKILSAYTAPTYPYEVRQNAFTYLYQLQLLSDTNLKDLVNACLHHTWHFAKTSRTLLELLLKDPKYKKRLQRILPELRTAAQDYLRTKLEA
ncbi:MAG: M1 family metallopeptidase [Bacteroidota bacterium]